MKPFSAPERRTTFDGQAARILVVEDDAEIRNLVVTLLAECGYQIEQAGDGLVALDKMRGRSPDLVVLDLFLPKMDGWELLNVSRMTPSCTRVPVVVISAGDQLPTDKRVRAFLKKPFDLDLLRSAVASLLNEHASGFTRN